MGKFSRHFPPLVDRLARFLLAAIAAIVVATEALADSPPVLRLDGSQSEIVVAPYAQILEDATGRLDLARVRATATGWRAGAADAVVIGISHSAWWLRWRIENATARTLNMVFDLGNPRQDYLQWFEVRGNTARITEGRTGDRLARAERPLPARNFAIPLTLAPHESMELYVRLQSYDGLFEAMPMTISTDAAFAEAVTRENLVLTLYHGALLAFALYHLLLFALTRERVFGWYVFFLLSFLLWSFTFRGFSYQYLWPQWSAFNNDVLTVGAAWAFAGFGLFAEEYLRMRERAPRWLLQLNRALIAANLLVAVPAFAGHYTVGAVVGWVTGLALAVVGLSTGGWLLSRGMREARFFMLSFVVLGAGAFAYILQIIGVVPTNWLTSWGLHIGSTVQVLLLATGLADSMNTLKAQKLEAERQARAAQEILTTQLEQQVIERTQALELANRRLNELAITDELTGAFNRRHFNDVCRRLMEQRGRSDPLALCMFDIDHFKPFNDRYGHQAGDSALRDVARAVSAQLKRADDRLFRLGGEEFGVLFTAVSAESAAQFIGRLRRAVQELRIPHADSPSGTLTVSFGAVWWPTTADLTPEKIYGAADRLLYEAKAAGRDRILMKEMEVE